MFLHSNLYHPILLHQYKQQVFHLHLEKKMLFLQLKFLHHELLVH